MFGCALLPLVPPSPAALQPDHVALYLVVPDGWTFDMHRCEGGEVTVSQCVLVWGLVTFNTST